VCRCPRALRSASEKVERLAQGRGHRAIHDSSHYGVRTRKRILPKPIFVQSNAYSLGACRPNACTKILHTTQSDPPSKRNNRGRSTNPGGRNAADYSRPLRKDGFSGKNHCWTGSSKPALPPTPRWSWVLPSRGSRMTEWDACQKFVVCAPAGLAPHMRRARSVGIGR